MADELRLEEIRFHLVNGTLTCDMAWDLEQLIEANARMRRWAKKALCVMAIERARRRHAEDDSGAWSAMP